MNNEILEAIQFAESAGIGKIILAIPFPMSEQDLVSLHEREHCEGIVIRSMTTEMQAGFSTGRLGKSDGHGWNLPRTHSKVVFVGSHLMLTRKMMNQVVRSGRYSVICKINGKYETLTALRFYVWRMAERVLDAVSRLSPHHPVRKIVWYAANVALLQKLWRRLFRPHDPYRGLAFSDLVVRRFGLDEEAFFRQLLLSAQQYARDTSYVPVPGRVLLVNAGLAAGGTERQIVNTLIGLRDSGLCESVGLLAEYIDHAPNLDFFLRELETAEIPVTQLANVMSIHDDGLATMPHRLADLLSALDQRFIEEVLNLAEEFRSRKPEVVHAWQDQTSIKVGIAAAIAGVPRIVLASRNVAPANFTYYQTHMRSAYRALAELKQVKFTNNSEVGLRDYTQWLGLPGTRFSVIRNGVAISHLKRTGTHEIWHYRNALGIPESAFVVGSVYRFWPEKRPMLWLEAAAEIAHQFDAAHFLIIGDGILRREMERFIRQSGLAGRIHLPGARPDVAPALSAMDVFLLTSEHEGTPNVILEAQWMGLPVVATDSGGTREAFANGETGLLVERADPAEIANAVSRLVRDREFLNKCSENGKAFVQERFGMTRMIRETLDIYGLSVAVDSRASEVGGQA